MSATPFFGTMANTRHWVEPRGEQISRPRVELRDHLLSSPTPYPTSQQVGSRCSHLDWKLMTSSQMLEAMPSDFTTVHNDWPVGLVMDD